MIGVSSSTPGTARHRAMSRSPKASILGPDLAGSSAGKLRDTTARWSGT